MTNWPGGPGGPGGQGYPPPGGWQQSGQQPWQGQPGPGQPPYGPAPQQWVGSPYGPPGPPPKNRTPLIIGLVLGAVVLLVAGVITAVVLSGGSDGSDGNAGDAVKGYVEALARGDAAGALAYSDAKPGSMDFLSDDILKKQIEHSPISNVQILSDDSTTGPSFGFAMVHVRASFGDKVSDETMHVKKTGDGWKLDSAAVKLEQRPSMGDDKSMQDITLFGKPLGNGAIYVFPGWLDFASANSNLTVTSEPVLLSGLAGYSSVDVTVDLADGGRQAADKAIRDALSKCAESKSLKPRGCPQSLNDSDAVDNTASWGEPTIGGIDLRNFNNYSLEMLFSMDDLVYPVSVKMTDGSTRTGTVDAYANGRVDMSQNPPVVSFS